MIAFIDNSGVIVCRAETPFDLAAERILTDWFAGAQRAYLRCGRFTVILPDDNSGCVVGQEFAARAETPTTEQHLDRIALAIAPSHPLFADVMLDLRAERDRHASGTSRRVA